MELMDYIDLAKLASQLISYYWSWGKGQSQIIASEFIRGKNAYDVFG